jgi:2-methylcitrate dehydratase PrpD
MDAVQRIVREHSLDADHIESIDVEIPAFLTDMVPNHRPATGLEAKYSLEYSVATVVLDGRAGIHQFSDAAVRRPAAQSLLERVRTVPVEGGPFESRVVVTLQDGGQLEATVNRAHGNPADPLTEDERLGKFHECAATLASPAQRDRIVELTAKLDAMPDVAELAAALAADGS